MVRPTLAQAPAPTITTLSPVSAATGSPGFVLTVNGTNFVMGSVICWNLTPLTTIFVSATSLTTNITASMIAADGTPNITVLNLPGSVRSLSALYHIFSCGGSVSHYSGATISATAPAFVGIQGEITAVRNKLCGDFGLTSNWVGVNTADEWVQVGTEDAGGIYQRRPVDPINPGYQIYYETTQSKFVDYKIVHTHRTPSQPCVYMVEFNPDVNIHKWQVTYDGITMIVEHGSKLCAFKVAQWQAEAHNYNDHTPGTTQKHNVTAKCQFKTQAGWIHCSAQGPNAWKIRPANSNSASSVNADNCDVWDPRDQ